VTDTASVSVHPRAAGITLDASASWPAGQDCVSQNQSITYSAVPTQAGGAPISSCSGGLTAGCIYDDDYVWSSDNSNVATVSAFGVVVAHNPGVANIFARLNGTVSAPLAFATCPPDKIVLTTSPYTTTTPVPPFATSDLASLSNGDQRYATASMVDKYGFPLSSTLLTYTSSAPIKGSFGTPQLLSYPVTDPMTMQPTTVTRTTATLGIHSAGGFTMTASCAPPECNPAVANFVSPNGPTTGSAVGFGYPVYSNVLGATANGIAASRVLVTGTLLANGATEAHRMEVFNSESMAPLALVAMPNVPNSLVVSPDGKTAYAGSSSGLMVVNLTTYGVSLQTYPIEGGQTNPPDLVTGKVLGVSADSRYVVVSDVDNSLVFLIDTTGTKMATRYTLAGINAVGFAQDGSNIWLGGDSGVYVFQADTFVLIGSNASSNVGSIAWIPDGQSYFASGDQLVNYSTCDDSNPQLPGTNLPSAATDGLATTAVSGVSHLLGINGAPGAYAWFDYSVTASSLVPQQSVAEITDLVPGGTGNVCTAMVTVAVPVTAPSTLQCTAQKLSFAPALKQQFVTGVNPACGNAESVLHGYDLATQSEITLATSAAGVPLSGDILDDGRKLYFGTWSGDVTQTSTLHRIDLATSTGTPGTLTEDASVPVSVIPDFVAVVPN